MAKKVVKKKPAKVDVIEETGDQFLTEAELLKLELNSVHMLNAKLAEDRLRLETKIVLQQIEILKKESEIMNSKMEILSKKTESVKLRNRDYNKRLKDKYSLKEKWGYDPDSGKLV